ncbi:MAG: hypothetical protein Q9208_007028 [Pyrenodesmia sp. 3 TL-2023]
MGKNKEPKPATTKLPLSEATTFDSHVTGLFASSLKTIKPASASSKEPLPSAKLKPKEDVLSDDIDRGIASAMDPIQPSQRSNGIAASSDTPTSQILTLGEDNTPRKKRKRKRDEDDIEGKYMQRIARPGSQSTRQRPLEARSKRPRLQDAKELADNGTSTDDEGSDSLAVLTTKRHIDSRSDIHIPPHESLAPSKGSAGLEKAARTVFLGNVTTSCIKFKSAKKTLLGHLSSFCPSLPAADTSHKIESLRFRSTPFASGVGPKKAAYAKRELMDATTKSTNAYVVYTTSLAAREAVKRLNGSVVLERHLLVDSVAHPRKTDHRRCVFVGNLGFVDDDSQINAAKAETEGKKSIKTKEPSDVEEGLWRQFTKAGQVESVRVVRDGTTRVGKGFAYVQFQNENAVEKALLYDEKKYPPLLPRMLRVTRAKKMTKTASQKPHPGINSGGAKPAISPANYSPKDPVAQSMSGRAGKLFGRAGAAHLKSQTGNANGRHFMRAPGNGWKAPERVVFEGHRASSKQSRGAKLGGSRTKQGKPRTRSSRRGADFKAKGGKKAGTKA